jgi:hypothetical protein
LRDALSLLDQVLALTGGEISQEAVGRILGLVEEERYAQLLDIIRDRRHGEVFSFVEALLDEGYDLVEFHRGLIDAFRNVLRLKLSQGKEHPDLSEAQAEIYRERMEGFSGGDLVRMLAQATELESSGSLRRSAHPRLLLEMLLLRMSYQDKTVELEALLRGLGPEGVESEPGGAQPTSPPTRRGRTPVPSEVEGPAPKTVTPREPTSSLQEAWRLILDSPDPTLPKGVAAVLRGARTDFSVSGRIRISLPAGLGRDKIEDPRVRKALAAALLGQGQDGVEIELLEGDPPPSTSGRITEETVRRGRLQELMEKEPTLEEAVKELDLELLD